MLVQVAVHSCTKTLQKQHTLRINYHMSLTKL